MIKRIIIIFMTLLLCFSINVFATDTNPPAEPDNSGLIGGIVGGLLDGLKSLFIPDKDFFEEWNKDISTAWDNKVGGITRSWQAISDQFKSFRECDSGEKHKLNLEFKEGHFFNEFKGAKVDLFAGIGVFSRWIKGFFSGLMVITVGWFGYRKISKMFKG